MRMKVTVAASLAAATLSAMLLSGCGDSNPASPPASQATSASSPAAATSAGRSAEASESHSPTIGAFAQVASASLQQAARKVDDCNIDAIDDKPADGAQLSHAGSATFAGWAADSVTRMVPASVRLVLKGVDGGRDFAIETATGATRTDVAQARKIPAFAASGWSVKADLTAVPPGRYDALLAYTVAGQSVVCDPHHVVTVE